MAQESEGSRSTYTGTAESIFDKISPVLERGPGVLKYRNQLNPKPKPPVNVEAILKAAFLFRVLHALWAPLTFSQKKLVDALLLVAQHWRNTWVPAFPNPEAEATWAEETAKRIRAASRDINHIRRTSRGKSPWLKKLFEGPLETPEEEPLAAPTPADEPAPTARASKGKRTPQPDEPAPKQHGQKKQKPNGPP